VRREPEAVSIKKLVGYKNCISIDPSSNSLAWAVINYDNKLIGTGKISLGKGSSMSAKLQSINDQLPEILSKYKVDRAVIEQSVYIQNFQSSRILSYIIGHTFGEIIRCNIQCEDVSPLSWKPGIGYKNLSKREVEELKKQGIDLSNQAKLKTERKDRVRRIIMMAYGKDIENIEDDDIVDAIGIGLWYHLKYAARAI
jgi:Holliday junction resolvasome RuvABC endonuclease subunit